jgi:hypothetical protein
VSDEAHISLAKLGELADETVDTSLSQVALALTAMARRSSRIGIHYPFEVTDGHIKVAEDALEYPYTSLLVMTGTSPAGQYIEPTTQEFQNMAITFEQVTEEAVRSLLGPGSKALRFGHPSDIGRPSDFQEAIVWLAKRMGADLGEDYKPPRFNDCGVDVVGWRPFPDGKPGMPVVLVQCTLQRDYTGKAGDVDLRQWAGWLDLRTPATAVLAIPGHVAVGEKWNEISRRSMILDRTRLAGLVGKLRSSEIHLELLATARDRIEQLAPLMEAVNW